MSEILDYIKRLAIGTSEGTRFAESADVVIEHYNSVLTEDITNSPTIQDIARYYTYYTAYTKLTAILQASGAWTTKDIFPIPFEEYKNKALEIGWSFVRQSVGIECKGWEAPVNDNTGWDNDDDDHYCSECGEEGCYGDCETV